MCVCQAKSYFAETNNFFITHNNKNSFGRMIKQILHDNTKATLISTHEVLICMAQKKATLIIGTLPIYAREQ